MHPKVAERPCASVSIALTEMCFWVFIFLFCSFTNRFLSFLEKINQLFAMDEIEEAQRYSTSLNLLNLEDAMTFVCIVKTFPFLSLKETHVPEWSTLVWIHALLLGCLIYDWKPGRSCDSQFFLFEIKQRLTCCRKKILGSLSGNRGQIQQLWGLSAFLILGFAPRINELQAWGLLQFSRVVEIVFPDHKNSHIFIGIGTALFKKLKKDYNSVFPHTG